MFVMCVSLTWFAERRQVVAQQIVINKEQQGVITGR